MLRLTKVFFTCWILLSGSILLAQTEEGQIALTLENIFTRTSGSRDATISPDGRWAAVVARQGEDRGIFLVSTAAGEDSSPTFWVEGSSPVWTPDGQGIVFSKSNDLWSVRRGEKSPSRITEDDERERDATISPDGSKVAFFSNRGGHHDIWLVPTDGSQPPRQLTRGAMADDDYRFAPMWSPDGKQIAYVSFKDGYWQDDVWLVDVENGQERKFSDGFLTLSNPAWSPDGKRLAVMGTAEEGFWYEDMADIYLLDVPSGTRTKLLMQVFATDRIMRYPLFWSEDGKQIFFLYQERGNVNLWAVPSEGGVATRVTNMEGTVGAFTASRGSKDFLFTHSTPVLGSDTYFITNKGGLLQRLTHFARPWENVTKPIEIYFRSFDGLYIQGFLYLPPDMQQGQKYPALVQVHGGGTNSYMNGLNLSEQYLASKGYVVMAINYRGGSGFGREFQDLAVNDWANGQAYDAGAAADFLRSLSFVNNKVGIYGYSYGGIMTMAAITRVPDKFDAAVPMAGIYDFADAYTTADRLGRAFSRAGHSGSPEERPDIYARSNSLARIENIQVPLLIMHGEEDVRAPFRQFEMAVELLEKHGKNFIAHSYPGEPHGFRNPENRIDMYQRLEAFFDKHLKE